MKNGLMLAMAFAAGCAVICFVLPTGQAQQPNVPKTSVLPQSATSQPAATQAHLEVDDQSQPSSFWMEQKLRISKELLTGLATADFDAIGRNAELMRGLNRVESFVRRGPEGYRDQLTQFNMATDSLIRASLDENLEAATLAFNQLTISCVGCHQHLRELAEAKKE